MTDQLNDFGPPTHKGEQLKAGEVITYPSIACDPSIKVTMPYALQMVKALYFNNWNTFGTAYGNNERARMIDNVNWSNGKFDTTAWQGGRSDNRGTLGSTSNGNSSSSGNARGAGDKKNPLMKHIDFDPVTEQSKYRDIVVGYMEDLDFEITASTINPAAAARKENFRLSELANLRLKQSGQSQKIDQSAGMPIMPQSNLQFPVNDEQELNMYFQLGGFKQIAELEIELGNQIVNNDSDWKNGKKMNLEDTFDKGAIAVDIEYCKDGRFRKKYVDPINCGKEDYRGHFLKRPGKIFYIELMTVHEVLQDSAGQFTMEQMMSIAQMFQNKFGNPAWSSSQTGYNMYVNTDASYPFWFYSWHVPVMKLYWDELDIYKTKELKFADGRMEKGFASYEDTAQTPEDNPNIVDKTIKELSVHRYYQTKWIVNTEWVYDYGRVPYQARDPFNATYALCPLKYYRITQQSMAERIKTHVKKIYLYGKKIDNEVARKKPSGWVINVKALENIALGQGSTFTVKHAIEMWNETGDLLISDEGVGDEFNRTRNKVAAIPLEHRGWYETIQGYMTLINHELTQISNVTGINEFMDATNPNGETTAAVAKMASQGTKNSMSQIASAMLQMEEKCAIDLAERIRLCVAKNGEYNGYGDALGDGLAKAVSVTDAVITHRFAIRVQAKPTTMDRAELKQAVYQAFSNMATPEQGGLWVTDALYFEELINNGTNFKIIRLMLSATIRQKMAMMQQQRMQMIDAQTKSLTDSKQSADMSELQKYAQMKKIDMLYEQFMTGQIVQREAADNNSKTGGKLATQSHKATLDSQQFMLFGKK